MKFIFTQKNDWVNYPIENKFDVNNLSIVFALLYT